YQNHRENQLERILEAAEALFIQEGIDNVSLSAIASAARLSRKTLYVYFSNKEDIAWAIMQNLVDEKTTDMVLPQIPEGSGFQRVEFYMLHMVNRLVTYPEHMRFISEFSTLYAREGEPTRVRQMFARGGKVLNQMIQQGIEDGSIRPDVEQKRLTTAILNLVSGMNCRFALLGDQISQEYDQPVMDIYRDICRIFLRGIQSSPCSSGTCGMKE
ncbi:MAG: TetR/AcrR family transcriptional regulator, partial [Anaerolineae bacterium]|nr:TetR/AcrR family transcriptional regulator [Anaerolineae bacterium]